MFHIYKPSRRFLLGAISFVTILTLVAWTRIYAGTPYTGVFWLSSIPNGMRSNLRNVVWDTTGVNEIKNNGYFEEYDQTADCVGSPKVGDKFKANTVVTTMPNTGVFAYNDCDGPGPNVNEEVELALNSNSVVAGTNYQYDVNWICNQTNISGEVNVTFEYINIYRDWNTKSQYYGWCGIGLQSVTNSGDNWNSERLSTPNHALVYETSPQTSALHYKVLRSTDGFLRARAFTEFQDGESLRALHLSNIQLLESRKKSSSDQIFAVVTLYKGITSDQLLELLDKSGLQIVSYGAFGYNLDNQQVAVYMWPENNKNVALPNEDGVEYYGIYTFSLIGSPADFDYLLSTNEVALLDLTANQIQEDIQTKLGEAIELTQIGVPNPAWQIVAGELKTP